MMLLACSTTWDWIMAGLMGFAFAIILVVIIEVCAVKLHKG